MARINLLPWRDELRKERQQQFYSLVGLSAGLMVAIIVLVHINFAGIISNQQDRNKYLKGEIKKLDARIKEIEELEKLLIDFGVLNEEFQ